MTEPRAIPEQEVHSHAVSDEFPTESLQAGVGRDAAATRAIEDEGIDLPTRTPAEGGELTAHPDRVPDFVPADDPTENDPTNESEA